MGGASDEASRDDPLGGFRNRRSSIVGRRVGDGGIATCRALSDALDADLASLASAAIGSTSAALVAVGGYGRRDLCIWSDVDVMLLHGGGGDAARISQDVFYPLWDAKLRVGHATRTVAESLTAAAERFETFTALLTSRLITGDESLFAELLAGIARSIRGSPLASQLARMEGERRASDPYPVMAADLKDGRGALRTFNGFEWERRRADLIGQPPPYEETREETRARNELLAVRNALHAVSGKQVDEFVYDLRPSVATWLGVTPHQAAVMVCQGTSVGDRLAIRRWPDLVSDAPASRGFTTRLVRRFRNRQGVARQDAGPLEIALAAARRPEGVWIDGTETDVIKTAVVAWEAADREALVELLAEGGRGRTAFGLLADLGWVERALPEIAHVTAAPQMAPFHEHPVDSHLWRTVDEINSLIGGGDGWYSAIGSEIEDPAELRLAAFLHDVGKGHRGDHSVVGAAVATALLERLGFEQPAIAHVAKIVEHHLLLADAATGRDTADPAVISEVAAAVGDMAMLRSLYLVTVADSKATGRTMWSDWKATLLRSLFVKVAAELDPSATTTDRAALIAAVAGTADRPVSEVAAWIESMPADYIDLHTAHDVAIHMDHSDAIAAGSIIELDAAPIAAPMAAAMGDAIKLIVSTPDRSGLLGAIAGVLALRGIEVIDARLVTRSDGIAVDTFHVSDVVAGRRSHGEFWNLVGEDIAGAFRGDLDIDALLAEKLRAYRSKMKVRPVIVRSPARSAMRSSLQATAIEVRCHDRPGVLYEIVQELYSAGLGIDVARIDTLGDEVRDTFFVRESSGEALDSVARIAEIVDSVRRGLTRRLA